MEAIAMVVTLNIGSDVEDSVPWFNQRTKHPGDFGIEIAAEKGSPSDMVAQWCQDFSAGHLCPNKLAAARGRPLLQATDGSRDVLDRSRTDSNA